MVRISAETIAALEQYRRDRNVIPTRPEAIRSILTDWLREKGYLPK